jgi:hypothetical protein
MHTGSKRYRRRLRGKLRRIARQAEGQPTPAIIENRLALRVAKCIEKLNNQRERNG